MSAPNIIAIVSIVAGAIVTITSGWLQYRGTRMAQKQDRLLNYENRIGERRISAYLDVLTVVLPIKKWGQEYTAGQMLAPPALEINQELLVSLAAFGSSDINRLVNQAVRYLDSLRNFFKPFAPAFKKLAAANLKIEDFATFLSREQPDDYTLWVTVKSTLDDLVELATTQIDYLEKSIRG